MLHGFWISSSLPGGEIPTGSAPAVELTLALWREKQLPISYLQANSNWNVLMHYPPHEKRTRTKYTKKLAVGSLKIAKIERKCYLCN
jgi:hypothetical protein